MTLKLGNDLTVPDEIATESIALLGRVNTWRRMKVARAFQCATVDGTKLRFGPRENIRALTRWMRRMEWDSLFDSDDYFDPATSETEPDTP